MEKIINIGSTNKVKIIALKDLLQEYSHLKDYVVASIDVPSDVSEQPLSLEETISGAINRAKSAFQSCEYSFGIESGLMIVPYTKSGYMDVCVCAIYDGENVHLGLSSAWEFNDPSIFKSIVNEHLDMNQAAVKAGITTNEKIGQGIGTIGLATKGKLNRIQYTQESIRTALIHIQ